MDISKCFSESLRIRDDESRLYIDIPIILNFVIWCSKKKKKKKKKNEEKLITKNIKIHSKNQLLRPPLTEWTLGVENKGRIN